MKRQNNQHQEQHNHRNLHQNGTLTSVNNKQSAPDNGGDTNKTQQEGVLK